MELRCQLLATAALSPRKETAYPLYRSRSEPQGLSQQRKIFCLLLESNNDSSDVQSLGLLLHKMSYPASIFGSLEGSDRGLFDALSSLSSAATEKKTYTKKSG